MAGITDRYARRRLADRRGLTMQNRTKEMSISVDVLRAAVRYDAESGETFWLERPKDHFAADGARHTQDHICSFWNSKHAGKNTGTTVTKRGYRFIRINRCGFMAHRVIWAIVYGAWPVGEIDHIDGNKSNNRITNLRQVDRVGNTRNDISETCLPNAGQKRHGCRHVGSE